MVKNSKNVSSGKVVLKFRNYKPQSEIPEATTMFKGNNYDFTLRNVKSHDTPSEFSFKKYFGITNITKPQTNARIGYFFKEFVTLQAVLSTSTSNLTSNLFSSTWLRC